MKRYAPYLVLLVAVLWLASSWRSPKPETDDFDTTAFSRIPVLAGGRIKPIDTVARNSLMIMRGKQSLRLEGKPTLTATRWLADVLFNPAVADTHPVFAVANQEVLGMFGMPQKDKRYCTYDEIKPHLPKIEEERKLLNDVEAAKRTPFQTAIYNLHNGLILYQRLKTSIHEEGTSNFADEVGRYAAAVEGGAKSIQPGAAPVPQDQLNLLRSSVTRYQRQSEFSYMLTVAPPAGGKLDDWLTTGDALIRVDSPQTIPASVAALADMSDAFRANDRAKFAMVTKEYAGWLAVEHPEWTAKTTYELRFNRMEPFYQGMVLYVGAFLLVIGSWLVLPKELWKAAFMVLLLALLVHSFGLVSRMWIQGRPPVTNLYSSAILVGWGAVALAMFLEGIFRYGIALACACVVGFTTLIIAHHLGATGDTMEMMQAVLDSNIWLATHVVVITLGYSAMFLAGVLAVAYVILGLFTDLIDRRIAKMLTSMVYGIICFATLFSFVGTVLGGIWADQSWGRFWGWDPKENGALLIVLWCALILHARWGGYIRQRGLMAMAIVGNAITAFSWFGVNMLGVGLHSYGFMDKAFPWLLGFVISQFILVGLAQIPSSAWRSFADNRPN